MKVIIKTPITFCIFILQLEIHIIWQGLRINNHRQTYFRKSKILTAVNLLWWDLFLYYVFLNFSLHTVSFFLFQQYKQIIFRKRGKHFRKGAVQVWQKQEANEKKTPLFKEAGRRKYNVSKIKCLKCSHSQDLLSPTRS